MRGWRRIGTLLAAGSMAQDRLRTLLAVAAIALGVALGFAVQLINGAAVNELAQGVQALSGAADLEVRGPRTGFDEALYPTLAALPEVAIASPVVEANANLIGRDEALHVLGIDLFRAAGIAPALVPRDAPALDVLRPDVVFLSASAAQWLALDTGDTIALQSGVEAVRWRVGGVLRELEPRVAIMDIAAAQSAFDRLGRLSRVDLRLRPGVGVDAFAAALRARLPAGVTVARPETVAGASASLSRAYRVNLNVLALVALFTGALLVFSTQALSVVRRRAQLALLRVLGVTRRELVRLLVLEGGFVGVAGAVLGLLLGAVLANVALRLVGADLGSGYFRGVTPRIAFDPVDAAIFLVVGIAMAAGGSIFPALEAARAAPAQALKAGDEQQAFTRLKPWTPGLATLALGGVATLGPPVLGLPLFGYASIALLLIGTLMLLPRFAINVWGRLPLPRAESARLALAQLRGAPGQATVSLASIVASVSLMVSMGIMVASFRSSLETWLHQVLPADLYVRAGPSGDTAYLPVTVQARIKSIAGVERVDFIREQQLLLDPERPRVVLMARDIDAEHPERLLALTAMESAGDALVPPVWLSEPAAALYGYAPGDTMNLPLAGRTVAFRVAGIWRDYARQQGAIVMERSRYVDLTGDASATNAALWLATGTNVKTVREALAQAIPDGEVDVALPEEIRAASLHMFDRTFAVTYALELAAVLIGLAGLSSAFGALVLARRREFGMLRHLGMLRRQIAFMLASEGLFVSAVGLAVGVTLGWLMSLVLIHVVNRQSFHWGMELTMPWVLLVTAIGLMLGLAMLTAVVSGRVAMAPEVVRAVREDW